MENRDGRRIDGHLLLLLGEYGIDWSGRFGAPELAVLVLARKRFFDLDESEGDEMITWSASTPTTLIFSMVMERLI